jgi:elongation factor P hydroxylase
MAISQLVEMQHKAHSKRIQSEFVDEVDKVCKCCKRRSTCDFEPEVCSFKCAVKSRVDKELQKNLYKRVANLISTLCTPNAKLSNDDMRRMTQTHGSLH